MSVVCLGELLIDFVANESGVTVGEASGFMKKPGGAPANVAVAVRRLGHPAAFMTKLGNDPFGHFLLDVLKAEAVDTRGVRLTDEARTALAFVSLGADGERSFSFYRHPYSADMLLRPDDIAYDVIDQMAIFHYGSITFISEPSRSAQQAALTYAQSHGKLISYDVNLRLALWESEDAARAQILAGLAYAHLVKVSDEELVFLTGADDVAALWRDHTQAVIVTHGAGGATAYTRSGAALTAHHVAGFGVDAVDTTGAGDGFMAAVLVRILEIGREDYHAHLPEILRFANAVGAIVTTQYGAIPALPTREAVDAFLQRASG